MKAKKYILDAILDLIPPEGAYSKDLVESVSKKVGMPVSKMKIAGHMRVLYEKKLVRKEAVVVDYRLKRYKWFKNPWLLESR